MDKTSKNTNVAELEFQLAKAWHLRGKTEVAIAGYQRVLEIQSDYAPALLELGHLMLQLGHTREALEYYERVLFLNPGDTKIRSRHAYLKDLLENKDTHPYHRMNSSQNNPTLHLEDNPEGKINLYNQKTFTCHRSGWNYALNTLRSLHHSQGILFDGFIEDNFVWQHWEEGIRPSPVLEKMKQEGTFGQLATSEERGVTPYTQPWVGCLHNPHGMPSWFHYHESPQTIFAKDIWKRSLPYCIGLFTFSHYHAQWLREQTGKPVSVLFHPTEFTEVKFIFDKFISNPRKKIVQIGWWLRKLNAIHQLPIPKNNPLNYEKIRLIPLFFDNADKYLKELMAKERRIENLTVLEQFSENTKEVIHISNDEYDRLLSENIAFIDLYDSNANNVVIECIARATPLVINPLPPVVEYLGKDYPMYFGNLSEAAKKALDISLIRDTHLYLVNCETRKKLSAEYFLKSFKESDVYQLI